MWLEDETRLGLQGVLRRQWGERGQRLVVPRERGYRWTYLYGVGCPASGETFAWELPEVNTALVNQFLQRFSASRPKRVHVLLLWDGAPWHRAEGLVVPANITRVSLPPYSPELNPMENVWKVLKGEVANRVYGTLTRLTRALFRAWNRLTQDLFAMRSLLHTSYLNPGS